MLLTNKERVLLDDLLQEIPREFPRTKSPLIIAMVGLIGSGKSTVATFLSKLTKSLVIETDAVRLRLRKIGASLDNANLIAHILGETLLKKGVSVIFDSDYIADEKREAVQALAEQFKTPLYYVRTIVDPTVASARIINDLRYDSPDNFFGHAALVRSANQQQQITGRAIAIREILRRTPLHYYWKPRGGGTWILKDPLDFRVHLTVDTTKIWENTVVRFVEQIISA